MCAFCNSLTKAIDRYIAMADDELEEELESEDRVLPEESVKEESKLEEAIAAILVAETAYFIKKIKKQKSITDLLGAFEEIKAGDTCDKKMAEATLEYLRNFVPKLVVEYGLNIDDGIRITAVSKRTTAWIDNWSQELGRLMKLNSHKGIEDILKKSLENGDDMQTVTRTILDSGIRDEYYKARRVAMTELFRAHNVSRYEAALQSPSIVGKRWRHSGIGAPRPNHLDMDGETVDKAEPFRLQGADGNLYFPQFPVDPCLPAGESVNCHCTVDNVVDENILGLSAEERQQLRDEALAKLDEEWERSVDEKYRALVGLSTEEKSVDNTGKIKYNEDKQFKNDVHNEINNNYLLKINQGQQNKHIKGTNEYENAKKNGKERSTLTTNPEQLMKLYAGKSNPRRNKNGEWIEKESFTHTEPIGFYVRPTDNKKIETSRGMIVYSKNNGLHIYPISPKGSD